ncbi:MAG: hypothetical protein IKU03_00275 [Bacteroidales bacterium]|nr:hypothetical protein [Bacteroidales bacterium]
MKRIYTLVVLLIGLSVAAGAQNQYWNYYSVNVPCPKSAVSIVHENENIYYFQSDPTALSVMKINPLTMTPTGMPKFSYVNSELIMDGGFEDLNGDCVVFGHILPGTGAIPAYAIVDPSLNTLSIYSGLSNAGTIVDGCVGYDKFDNQAYMFVLDNGKLLAIGPNDQVSITPDNAEYYTDISWDDHHHCFVATGTWAYGQTHPGIIVDLFEFIPSDPNMGTPAMVSHNETYFLNNNTISDVAEHQAMHVQLDEGHLLVCRDLRVEKQDILWMTRIYDYWNSSHTVQESYLYFFPTHKLFALDLLYDPYHSRVNFLGELIYCSTSYPKLLSQVNPFKLSLGMNVGQLDGTFALLPSCSSIFDPSINIYGNVLTVSNLSLNIFHECIPVMIAGVEPGTTNRILTETYDISQLTCDDSLPIKKKPADPYIVLYPLTTTVDDFPFSKQPYTLSLDVVNSSIHCYGWDACPPLPRDTTEARAANILHGVVPEITIMSSRQFVCHGFDGKIQYALYDMTGRSLAHGTTYNDIQNFLPDLQGVFILNATDNVGECATRKIILFR